MPGDADSFEERAQAAFELALRRDGVIVDDGALDRLVCQITVMVASSSPGLIFYSLDMVY